MSVEVKPDGYNYVFSPYLKPVVEVETGEDVIVYTEDAFESRIKTVEDLPSKALATAKFLNPQTGPIYVKGAEPGDTLVVSIHSIEFTRDFAVSAFIKYFGGLSSTPTTRFLQEPLEEKVWIWNLVDDAKALYNEEIGVKIPVKPFFGTCATAPELEAIQALTPGSFGGNMDVPDVGVGNKIYLPVYNDGALFYIGDCHAAQGQGELCGVACEITAKARLSFEIIKGKSIKWPRIESKDKIMTVGSAKPMEDAARIAYTELIVWLEDEFGFTTAQAYELLTQVGGLYVGNMVDTTYSLVASIEKKILRRVND